MFPPKYLIICMLEESDRKNTKKENSAHRMAGAIS
jgi:hypothetical protein